MIVGRENIIEYFNDTGCSNFKIWSGRSPSDGRVIYIASASTSTENKQQLETILSRLAPGQYYIKCCNKKKVLKDDNNDFDWAKAVGIDFEILGAGGASAPAVGNPNPMMSLNTGIGTNGERLYTKAELEEEIGKKQDLWERQQEIKEIRAELKEVKAGGTIGTIIEHLAPYIPQFMGAAANPAIAGSRGLSVAGGPDRSAANNGDGQSAQPQVRSVTNENTDTAEQPTAEEIEAYHARLNGVIVRLLQVPGIGGDTDTMCEKLEQLCTALEKNPNLLNLINMV